MVVDPGLSHSSVLDGQGGGEEVDEQLCDALCLIVMDPVRRVGQAYPTLTYFNEVDKGGHSAAWEEPQLLAEEMRSPTLRTEWTIPYGTISASPALATVVGCRRSHTPGSLPAHR